MKKWRVKTEQELLSGGYRRNSIGDLLYKSSGACLLREYFPFLGKEIETADDIVGRSSDGANYYRQPLNGFIWCETELISLPALLSTQGSYAKYLPICPQYSDDFFEMTKQSLGLWSEEHSPRVFCTHHEPVNVSFYDDRSPFARFACRKCDKDLPRKN